MVAKTGAVLLLCLSASSYCLAQTANSALNVVVTGACTQHAGDPACALPNLYGPTGLTLAPAPQFPHYAHFIGSAQTTLNQTLGSAIATQLTILPLISPQSGFTFKYDSATGAIVRTTSSFGPIYTERAETIGRGKFTVGVSYQRFRFSSIDGVNLHSLPAVFTHTPDTGAGGIPEPYEADIISTTNDIDLKMDQTVLYGTVGITDRIDVSVAVPIVDVRLGVSSNANIIRVSGNFVNGIVTPGGVLNNVPNPHMFLNGGLSSTFAQPVTSASGIGDVTFRVKGGIYNGEKVRAALALDVRAPTGDPWKLLGSGAIGIKPFVAVSRVGRVSPHFNTGFQWNGSSILAGNITGITGISVDPTTGVPTPQGSGQATKARLPSQYLYSAGIDAGVTKNLTFVADYLGQLLINTPRVFEGTFTTTPPAGAPTTPTAYPTIYGGKDTIGLNSAATGLKYDLFGHLLLTADLLFRLDNRGLRQTVTPLVALSYDFGH